MKYLATSLVVIGLCGISLAEDVGWIEMNQKDAKSWDTVALLALIVFTLLVLLDDDHSKEND